MTKGILLFCFDTAETKYHRILEKCVKLIKKARAKHIGFASIIDRSTKKSLKIKENIISQLKINVPAYRSNKLPNELKLIPVSIPGSRFIK